jgi:predicted  nucleic acid-binding Zn-ribbon protein
MNQLLEYQKKDFELFKLEKQLFEGENKRKIVEMVKKVQEAQNKSLQLEKNAADLTIEFENLKKSFDENIKTLTLMNNSNIEKLSQADLASFEASVNALQNNLALIENKLSYFAKAINMILTDFENAKKTYNQARKNYDKHKQLYAAEEEKFKPEMEQKKKELAELEKHIDAKLLAKYKAKRQDKKFPIVVQLMDGACGGCQMELSYATLGTLKENGIIECEHCRRIIFAK